MFGRRLSQWVLASVLVLGGHALAQGRAEKFVRADVLVRELPSMRAEVRERLRGQEPLDRDIAVAAIVRLMDTAYLRVGSERYARREKPSFGASSLRKGHVRVDGEMVHLAFTGKSGVSWARTVKDADLGRAISAFLQQPGERLFPVTERQVRAFFRSFGVRPKDLRTFHANRLFQEELLRLGSRSPADVQVAIAFAATEMGHTPAVFRRAYLDPNALSDRPQNE